MKPAAFAVVRPSGQLVDAYPLEQGAIWLSERIPGTTVQPLYLPGAGANNSTASTLRTWAQSGEPVELSPEWLNNIADEIYLLEGVLLSQDQELQHYTQRVRTN